MTLSYWFKEHRETFKSEDNIEVLWLSAEVEVEGLTDELITELRNLIDDFCRKSG